jgi:hypothetical protein
MRIITNVVGPSPKTNKTKAKNKPSKKKKKKGKKRKKNKSAHKISQCCRKRQDCYLQHTYI